MRVVLVHNEYAELSGEEVVVRNIRLLLEEHGHEVIPFFRNSSDIARMRLGKLRALFSGIHSASSGREFAQLVEQQRPDVVQVQNVYPLISPVVFNVAAEAGIPVVFRCANYRMFCPNGLLFSRGEVCERCARAREYWCVVRNCERSIPKSLGYALRNACARASGAITRNTAMYYVPSYFQKHKFAAWGIAPERIAVIPNFIRKSDVDAAEYATGEYVGYAGRISPEKGVGMLLEAARKSGSIPFSIAGGIEPMPGLSASAPPNVRFLGRLTPTEMAGFYANARTVVVPSIWYETFGMVIVEAMLARRPVIASRIGPIPDLIDDNVTGLLFEPGNADELAEKIRYLWERPGLRRKMGEAGREKALREYSAERYYEKLMALYEKAIELGPGRGRA